MEWGHGGGQASPSLLGVDLPVWLLPVAPHPCSIRKSNKSSGSSVNKPQFVWGPWEEVDVVSSSPKEEILETLPRVCMH